MGNVRSRPESIEQWRRHGSRTRAGLPSQALDSGPALVSGTPQQAEELEICYDDIESSPPEDSRTVLMRGGLGLMETPEVTQWQSFTEIYLMENQLTELPEDPPLCPLLLVLFLNRNYKLRTISPSFFDYMPALEILNLSRTRIKSLPESLFRLSRLKRLFLNHCELLMVLPPKIGELQQLEVLDLEGTEIMDLPKEVANLTKLTCLEVSFCPRVNRGTKSAKANALIPQGTISALSQLEELSIDVNPEDERWESVVEAVVDDVCGLLRLDTLKLYFPHVGYLRKFKWFGTSEVSRSLSHFKFIVGNQDERVMSCLPVDLELELEHWDRSLKYVNGEGVPIEVQKMLWHTIAFFLDRHTDVTKLSDFGIENMEQLTCCIIGECNEIQVIIDGTDMYDEADRSEIVLETWENDRRFLGSLEYLHAYHMKSLRSIYEGLMHRGCLSHLKCLALLTCPRLTTIFTPGLLENLDSLEEIKVEDCPLILSLVRCEDACIYENTYFLPKLKKISLFSLPELISISNGLRIAPNLEQLSVVDCPNLKSPSPIEICFNHPTGTKAQSIPNDASREQPAPPVVSSTTTGNADPSTSKLKREPKVAPRLWKSLFNDRKLAARNFSAASLLGEVGSSCACGFTNDTSREQPAPTGVLFTPTSTAIDSVSSTTTSNTAISSSISSKTTSNTTANTLTSELTEEIIVAPQLRKFSLNDLKLATRNFSPEALLGEGGFGHVFKGWIEENGTAAARPGTGLTVAVKTLKLDGLHGHKEWLAEVSILGHREHPNLVKLIGYCKEDDQRLLIYEFMQGGSLNNHLFKRGTRPLPWSTRMKIALDAAKGLAFLHEEAQPQVIFCGFKTSKILLDADYNAKLSGSGLAKIVPKGNHHVYTRVMGTFGYAAPEYVATGLLTAKCDVYNFGVVLLEILTGRRVIDRDRPPLEVNLVEYVRPLLGKKKKLHELMDPRLKKFSEKGVQIAFTLAARCLSLDPIARPQMKEVVYVLKGLPDLPYKASSSTIFRTRQESTSSGAASKLKPR
ncbi:uncharacterized protein LOC115664234 isoform X2 [Syzygium oleosum]|uniref:uncharacterized protein LOC115664234 isoform X2 n=1 Tax=Syzygium oleosum TaxID=219896 RepID=UPI0024BB3419|nr:uncharacterized protein LOC115664234 isoform X2 [Syzygium oleosum]